MAGKATWIERDGRWIFPVMSGVWKVKDRPGVWVVRRRVTSEKTGQQVEVAKVLKAPTLAEAITQLDELVAQAKAGNTAPKQRQRFSSYAVSLLDRKVKTDVIKSASTEGNWNSVLVKHLVPKFGEHYIDAITRRDVLAYKDELAALVKVKKISAYTANNWLSILFAILNAAASELELGNSACFGIRKLPVKSSFTVDKPNALIGEDLGNFLAAVKEFYPAHYCAFVLMAATGLRPSHARPIRHQGPDKDVLWEKGLLLVRRSHTAGKIMESTKTGFDQALPLPPEVLDIIKWHIETNHTTKQQKEGEFLFSRPDGRVVSSHRWDYVCSRMERLGFDITPKGAGRRSFNSYHRAMGTPDHLIRAISGHHSSALTDLYTAVPHEQRMEVVAKVLDFTAYRKGHGGDGQSGKVGGKVPSEEPNLPTKVDQKKSDGTKG